MSVSRTAPSGAYGVLGGTILRRGVAAVFVVLAAALGLTAGCSSDGASSSDSSSFAGSDTAVTYIERDADFGWSPAEALAAEDADAIAHFLVDNDLRMLFPSQAPVADPGSVSVRFTAWHTVPTDNLYTDLVVFTKDGDKLITLSPDESPSNSQTWDEVAVRGQSGRVSEDPSGRWDLSWEEGGQSYLASSDQLTVDEAIAWLDTWYVLPDAAAVGDVVWTDLKLQDDGWYDQRFSDGLVALQADFKMGYLDKTGTWVIEPQFAQARAFSEGLAAVQVEWGGTWGFIDHTGAHVIDSQFYSCGDFSDGLAWAQAEDGSRYGYIDQTGAWVVQPSFDSGGDFLEGLAAVQKDGTWGYIDKTGAWVIQPQFAGAGDFSGGLAPVQLEARGLYGYADRTGTVVIEPQFERARSFSEALAAVGMQGLWGYIDATGAWVVEPQYVGEGDFSGGLAVVYLDAFNCGYIDTTGAYAIEPRAMNGELFTEGLARVEVEEGERYIDATGAYAFEAAFDFAFPFSEGMAVVSIDSSGAQTLWGLIDTAGTVVWQLEAQ